MSDNMPTDSEQQAEPDSLGDLLHQRAADGSLLDVVDAPESERKRKDKPKRKPKPAAQTRRVIAVGVFIAALVAAALSLIVSVSTSSYATLERVQQVTVPVIITATIRPFPTDTRAASPAPMFMTTPTASYEFEEPVMLNAVIEGFPIGTHVTIGSTWFDGTTRWYGVVTDNGTALEVSEAQLVPVPLVVTPQPSGG